MLFQEIKPQTKFRLSNCLFPIQKKKVYTKLEGREQVDYDIENDMPIFANAKCSGGFLHDIDDFVSVLVCNP